MFGLHPARRQTDNRTKLDSGQVDTQGETAVSTVASRVSLLDDPAEIAERAFSIVELFKVEVPGILTREERSHEMRLAERDIEKQRSRFQDAGNLERQARNQLIVQAT